jgi:DNA repair photolyase
MIVKEIKAKSILSKSKVFDYSINPYIGCQYGCIYCYAAFIKRFTKHKEPWGSFVDVKTNAVELLKHEIKTKKKGTVWISSMCDPYQPLEAKYKLTRGCLEILLSNNWPVFLQTRSALIMRDLNLLKKFKEILEVTISITTADEKIRKTFEPNSISVKARIKTLEKIHSEGIRTCVMIAPILPGVEGLIEKIKGIVDKVFIDRMNYHYADWVYRKYGMEHAKTEKFFKEKKTILKKMLEKEKIPFQFFF